MANNSTHTSATPALRVDGSGKHILRTDADNDLAGVTGLRSLQESFDKEQWDGLANVIYNFRDDDDVTLNPSDYVDYVLSFEMPVAGAIQTPGHARIDWDGSDYCAALMYAAVVKRGTTPTFPGDFTEIGGFQYPPIAGGVMTQPLIGQGLFNIPPNAYDIWFRITNPNLVQIFDVFYFYASLRRGRIPPS